MIAGPQIKIVGLSYNQVIVALFALSKSLIVTSTESVAVVAAIEFRIAEHRTVTAHRASEQRFAIKVIRAVTISVTQTGSESVTVSIVAGDSRDLVTVHPSLRVLIPLRNRGR